MDSKPRSKEVTHQRQLITYLPALISLGSTSSSLIIPSVQSPEHAPSCVLRSEAVDSLWPFERYHSPIILLAGVAPASSGQGVGNCWQSWIVPVYSGCTQVPTKAMPTLSVWILGTGLRAHCKQQH
jgi:hypothetical protein